jgi:hypothetical protein
MAAGWIQDAVAALTSRLAGQVPSRALLEQYRPDASWFLRPASIGGIHGINHETRVLVWQELLGRLVMQDGQTLDHEALRWAAVTHDTQRATEGLDPLHGARAAEWVRTQMQGTLPASTLETLAYLVRWHVPPGSQPPQMTPELAVFKDADGLDRVRLGGLITRYLRWDGSKQLLLPLAPALLAASNAKEREGAAPFDCVLDAAVELGLLLTDAAPTRKSRQATPAPARRQRKKRIYLRFGAWPKEERSANYVNDENEWGVSVYPARYNAEQGCWEYDTADSAYHIAYGGMAQILWRRPVYLVTGDEVGRGQDGEPLLRNVRIVGYCVVVCRGGPGNQALIPVSKSVWQALQALRGDGRFVALIASHW